jgi:hypothetical protein
MSQCKDSASRKELKNIVVKGKWYNESSLLKKLRTIQFEEKTV